MSSNKSVHIAENNKVSSNLFSDIIQIGDNSQINGNTTYNRLIKAGTAEILGEETDSISLPVVELPAISQFQTGNSNIILSPNEETAINPGDYNKVELKENSTLILVSGTYNISNLKLKQNSKLLYSDTTTLNIKTELRIGNNASIASNNPQVQDTTTLSINYAGKAPITVGEGSFITAKILSPDSRVQIADGVSFLGQILAKDIHVGAGGILGRKLHFVKESDLSKIVEDSEARFIVNEIVILLKDEATFSDALEIAGLVDGRITGSIIIPNIFKIEVPVETIEELNNKIKILREANNSLIIHVIRNLIGE